MAGTWKARLKTPSKLGVADLDDPHLLVRHAARERVRRVGSELVPELVKAAKKGGLEAAGLLGELGDRSTMDSVVSLLEDPEPAMRLVLQRALLELADADSILEVSGGLPRHRLGALSHALGKLAGGEALEFLVTNLGQGEARRDQFLGIGLAAGADPEKAVKVLSPGSRSKDAPTRATALQALGLTGSAEAVEPIVAALGAQQPGVGGAAVMGLNALLRTDLETRERLEQMARGKTNRTVKRILEFEPDLSHEWRVLPGPEHGWSDELLGDLAQALLEKKKATIQSVLRKKASKHLDPRLFELFRIPGATKYLEVRNRVHWHLSSRIRDGHILTTGELVPSSLFLELGGPEAMPWIWTLAHEHPLDWWAMDWRAAVGMGLRPVPNLQPATKTKTVYKDPRAEMSYEERARTRMLEEIEDWYHG